MIARWFNILSNLAFPIVLWGEPFYVVIGACILAIGSGWMHYKEPRRSARSIMADWIGMYVLAIAVLASVTNPWVLLLILPFLFIGRDIRNYLLIGSIVLITVFIQQAWLALILFGLAYACRQLTENTKYEAVGHGAFHILAAFGFKHV